MSGQGYPLDDRTKNRIAILSSDGHKQVDIARICGVSGKTVQRVQKGYRDENQENQEKQEKDLT